MRSMLRQILGFGLLLLCVQCVPWPSAQKDAGNAFRYYSRALEAYGGHSLGPALELINKAIAINGNIAGYYELKGNILSAKKMYKPALAAYGTALQYRSNYVGVQIKIAGIYFIRKEFIKARSSYKKAIAMAPEKIKLTLRLAECFLQTREYSVTTSVLDDYKRLAGKQLDDTTYFVLRAKTAFEKKNYTWTIAAARSAIKMGARQRTLFLVYLRALFYTNARETAYELLVHTAKPNLKKTDVHFFRGLYFTRQNNREDALVQLKLAVDGGTTIYEAYDLLAGFFPEPRSAIIRAKGKKWINGRLINGGE